MPFNIGDRIVTTTYFMDTMSGIEGVVTDVHEFETDEGENYYKYNITLDSAVDSEGYGVEEETSFYVYEEEIARTLQRVKKRGKSGFGLFVKRIEEEDARR